MISVLITGDFCPIGNAEKLSKDGQYDKLFGDILEVSKNADLSITNLECPILLGGEIANKFGPCLKAIPQTLEGLSYAGFNLVTLANNHIMDYGDSGLHATINELSIQNIKYVGAGNDLDEARRIFSFSKNGVKIGIINIAENEFSNTSGQYPGANPLDLPLNFEDIQNAKLYHDKIIVIYHGGNENFSLPSPRIKKTFRFFVNAGADVVVGHHTHCFSGFEIYKGKPIFYSIGNFIFDYGQRENEKWTTSYAVHFKIGDNIEFELIPYKQFGKQDGIQYLPKIENVEFKDQINKLNEIINNDQLLQQHFNEFALSLKNQFFHFLQPTSNRILHGLMKRNLLPSMAFGRRKNLHQNLIRCEAHRDILMQLMQHDSHS
jgi:poly-gamma-glutamate synthesis protein (capsule biosynthesis protein)